MADPLETIVQRMMDAGEPEQNIATVIQHFKTTQQNQWAAGDAAAAGAQATAQRASLQPPTIGGAVRGALGALNPLPMIRALSKPTDPAYAGVPFGAALGPLVLDPMRQQAAKAVESAQQGHDWEARGHAAAAALPVVGPMAAAIGERAQTDPAGAAGEAAMAYAGPKVMGGAIRTIQPMAGRIMQSVLKPSAALEQARNLSKAEIADQVLQSGLNVTRRGEQASQAAVDTVDAEKQAVYQDATQRGATADPNAVVRAVEATKNGPAGYTQSRWSPDVAAIDAVRADLDTNPVLSTFRQHAPVTRTVQSPILNAQGQPITSTQTTLQPFGAPIHLPIPLEQAAEFMTNTGHKTEGQFGLIGKGGMEAEKAARNAWSAEVQRGDPRLPDIFNREHQAITVRDAIGNARERIGNWQPGGIGWLASRTIPGVGFVMARSPQVMGGVAHALYGANPTALAALQRLAILESLGLQQPDNQSVPR